ncbi:class F sortase [Parafrankia colletiae]|uniref:Class F sortase n=1 Tax=Parafrankia colletiae TaxID=573497 RepID=A0A1S1QTY0_9ACTN|nr:class F sortase [Parafrankia colletiae]MCK9901852.1 class F sortase [Frankia sp. Cpl3]OHV36512.1 class F sortase [Parafrankia colletiae]
MVSLLLSVLLGCGTSGSASDRSTGAVSASVPASGVSARPTDAGSAAGETGAAAGAAAGQVADPVRIRVPAIGVSAPVVPLALAADGRLEAPKVFAETGWNVDGPEPGENGTAVIAGHVDSHTGPAVFFRLRELVPGDRVQVDRVDGSSAEFVVSRLERYPKDRLPSDEVYGPTGRPALRLITCGGTFDQARSSYRDNVIVFADLV